MLLKSSNNFIRFLIVPLAFCAMMFNARCKDDSNDELTQQTLLSLLSCKGGTMNFTIDGVDRTWTCCVAVNHKTYWEVVGSGGGEVVRVYIGDGTPGIHSSITMLNGEHEYIVLSTGGKGYYGVVDAPYDSGDSIINVLTNDDTSITGSFSGKVCNSSGTCYDIMPGAVFTALK